MPKRQEQRERGERQHEVRTLEPVAAARPIEQRRLRPGRDREPAEHHRLFPVEPFQHRAASPAIVEQHQRRPERGAIAARQPAREHEQQQAGQRRRDVAGFDERQRDEALEQRQPGIAAPARRCSA